MDNMRVKTTSKEYPIYFESDFAALPKAIEAAGLQGRRAIIVTDSNVAALYAPMVQAMSETVLSCAKPFIFEAGEEQKTLATIQNMYTAFMAEKLDRKSVVIALGGGVTGDMAGFAAATFMRGIPFIQIPTTLLSQVDSSVGGKTGVDFMGAKNIIGAFNQPELVYINISTLQTLPPEQLISGMGEVIKHGLILDRDYFGFLNANEESIKRLDTATMQRVVRGSCEIKAGVVAQDEKESGLREILNYGHTFGHAVESGYNFALPHGHCVALGIVCAMQYAVNEGFFREADMQVVMQALERFDLPTSLPNPSTKTAERPPIEAVYESMLSDKKTKSGKLSLVLPENIGAVRRAETDGKAAVIKALQAIYGGNHS